MTEAERLAEDRRVYLGSSLASMLLVGMAVAWRDFVFVAIFGTAAVYCVAVLVRTLAAELAEARTPWTPAAGLHVIDGADQ